MALFPLLLLHSHNVTPACWPACFFPPVHFFPSLVRPSQLKGSEAGEAGRAGRAGGDWGAEEPIKGASLHPKTYFRCTWWWWWWWMMVMTMMINWMVPSATKNLLLQKSQSIRLKKLRRPAANVLFIQFHYHLFNYELKFLENVFHAHWLRPFVANINCEIQLQGSRRVAWLRW